MFAFFMVAPIPALRSFSLQVCAAEIKETNMKSNDDLTANVTNKFSLFPKAITRPIFSWLFLGYALASCQVVFELFFHVPEGSAIVVFAPDQNGDLATCKT